MVGSGTGGTGHPVIGHTGPRLLIGPNGKDATAVPANATASNRTMKRFMVVPFVVEVNFG